MKKIKVELSLEEAQQLINLLDTGVKASGLTSAPIAAIVLGQILQQQEKKNAQA